jgi:hypothetical protein
LELNQDANKLARVLLLKEPKLKPVAILLSSTSHLNIIAMISILKIGHAFLNVPNDLPLERKKIMLSYCDLCVTDSKTILSFDDFPKKIIIDSEDFENFMSIQSSSNLDISVKEGSASCFSITSEKIAWHI